MTWTRLSDDFADHPELSILTRSARLLFVELLVYGNRHGTDGRFRRGLVARMTDAEDWPDLLDELVKREVLVDLGDGLLELDWAGWKQEPSDRVRERAERNAESNRLYRERGKRHDAGDHTMCTSRCPSRKASQIASRDGSRESAPSRPVPTPREGRDGQGAGAGSAGAPPGPAPGEQIKPHDFRWPRGYDPDRDEMDPSWSCRDCGQLLDTIVHFAHEYIDDEDEPGHCRECLERYHHFAHQAYEHYLTAVDDHTTWPVP